MKIINVSDVENRIKQKRYEIEKLEQMLQNAKLDLRRLESEKSKWEDEMSL